MLAMLTDCRSSARAGLSHRPDAADGTVAGAETSGDLLLVETSKASRAILQRTLIAHGFLVSSVMDAHQAYAEANLQEFSHAVVSLGARDRNGHEIVRQLRHRLPGLRIVIITDVDSFASVVMALRAGADDYIAKSADPAELIDALLDRTPELPPVPHMPLGLKRVWWEHIMRIHEQCGRNVSATAQRLRMHRRSLQRILGKRAPQLRADTMISEPSDKGLRRQYAGRGR